MCWLRAGKRACNFSPTRNLYHSTEAIRRKGSLDPSMADLDHVEELGEQPRDRKIDEAKAAVLELFREQPKEVFYGRQLEVLL